MGPSVVSLARSLVSERPEAAPDGSERMVIRAGGLDCRLLEERVRSIIGPISCLRCTLGC